MGEDEGDVLAGVRKEGQFPGFLRAHGGVHYELAVGSEAAFLLYPGGLCVEVEVAAEEEIHVTFIEKVIDDGTDGLGHEAHAPVVAAEHVAYFAATVGIELGEFVFKAVVFHAQGPYHLAVLFQADGEGAVLCDEVVQDAKAGFAAVVVGPARHLAGAFHGAVLVEVLEVGGFEGSQDQAFGLYGFSIQAEFGVHVVLLSSKNTPLEGGGKALCEVSFERSSYSTTSQYPPFVLPTLFSRPKDFSSAIIADTLDCPNPDNSHKSAILAVGLLLIIDNSLF